MLVLSSVKAVALFSLLLVSVCNDGPVQATVADLSPSSHLAQLVAFKLAICLQEDAYAIFG